MSAAIRRIAMWSGPRNISTAMMRAFENRADTAVWDEPFYAAYLALTGIDHPMRDEVIAAGPADPQQVTARLLGPPPDGATVFYQKHMAHHMVPAISRDWMASVDNCFLIRDPDRVLASYAAKRSDVALADIGFVVQAELFDAVAQRTGAPPPVLDADDVLGDPGGQLRALCTVLGISFDEAMLAWPPGPRASDGVWAPHWYAAVERSTGFAPPPADPPRLDGALRRISEQARPYYCRLRRHVLASEPVSE